MTVVRADSDAGLSGSMKSGGDLKILGTLAGGFGFDRPRESVKSCASLVEAVRYRVLCRVSLFVI